MIQCFLFLPMRNSAMDMLVHVFLCTSASVFQKERLISGMAVSQHMYIFILFNIAKFPCSTWLCQFYIPISSVYVCLFTPMSTRFINGFNFWQYNGWKLSQYSKYNQIFLIIGDIQLLFICPLANCIYFSINNLSYDFFPCSHWFIWVFHFCRCVLWI